MMKETVRSKPSLAKDFAALGLLLLLVATFFWKTLLLGKVVLPADVLTMFAPWKFFANGASLGNITLSDPVREFYPWKFFLMKSLKSGILPLWNPYVLGGTPFISNIQAALFYPLNVIFYLFRPAYGYGYYIMVHFFLGGVFMFLYVRFLTGSRAAALTAAIVFVFNMYVVNWAQQIPLISVIIWLPLVFLLIEKMVATRSLVYALLTGAVLALQTLGGNIQFSFYVFLATAVYLLFRIVSVWVRERRLRPVVRLGLFAAAMFVSSLSLAAIQLLPMFEMLSSIVRQGDSYRVVMTGAFKLEHLRTFLLPHYFNDAGRNFTWSSFPLYPGYVGVLPLLLAGLAPFLKRDKYTLFFAGFAVLSLLLALGTPLYKLLYSLPLGSTLRNPARLLFLYVFSLSVLSGLGMRHLASVFSKGKDNTASGPTVPPMNAKLILYFLAAAMVLAMWFVPEVLAQLITKGAPAHHLMREISFFLLFLSASSLLLALLLTGKIKTRAFQVLAVGVVVFDLFFYNINFLSYVEPKLVYSKTPSIRFLTNEDEFYRVVRFGKEPLYSPLTPNTGMVYGISDVQGSDVFILRRYSEFLNTIENHRKHAVFNEISNLEKLKSLESPLLDLLNVKYILSTGEIPGWSEHAVYNKKNRDMRIYRNPGWLPRAFLVSDYEVVATKKMARQRLELKNFDPRRLVVLEKEPSVAPKPNDRAAPSKSTFASSRVKITSYKANSVQLTVRSGKKNFLVLSEVFYPGWRSYVNGKEAEVLRANYILRAIYLPAGEHRVELTFNPRSYTVGKMISGLSGLLMVLYFALAGVARISKLKTA